MKKVLSTVSDWIATITDFLKGIIILGVVIGILFDDYFGVIAGIGKLMGEFGQSGLAGLVALVLVVAWYKKQ
ncbi:MAG: hypothetical protein H8E71_04500 [Candidatus Marinimicrobia bacterium]|nr:hypothetical protein [Candidatus Neomarinimicrobiota bacterium]MBL7108740.1 hypothetical protein [Candidatus Neomarinimicrobiota bacterium]